MSQIPYGNEIVSALGAVFLSLSVPLPALAQDIPPVDSQYRQYFVHYKDDRSMPERALNLIGLTSGDVGRSFALIAGVYYYPNMPDLDRELKPAAKDIEKLVEYLRDYEFFDEIVVLKNQHMNFENLTYFLQKYFPDRLRKFPKSRFLFAYTGHGISDGQKGYLLLNTAANAKDKASCLNLSNLRILIDEVVDAGYHVLVLINSCYCGSFLQRPFAEKQVIPKYPGAHAITAGASDEPTWHNPEIGEGSVFFEKLFIGLDGYADKLPERSDGSCGDGMVTVDELAAYLRTEVQISTSQDQNPLWGDISRHGSKGGFYFLNRKRMVANQQLPEYKQDERTAFTIEGQKAYAAGMVNYGKGDYLLAIEQFLRADKADIPEAAFALGYIHHDGRGVKKNLAEAYYWYRKASEADYASAMNNIGVMYRDGEGVTQDYAEAMRWLQKAAEAGNVLAMSNIGAMYRDGKGVAQDYAEAMRWLRKAADAGNASAMNNIGAMYIRREGGAQDYPEAMRWLHKAAGAGNASAISNIGAMYEEGLGVAQDYAEALRWYQKAADAGCASAMYYIGLLFEKGRGVALDLDEARRWYRKAADLGVQDATKRLRALEGQDR